MNLHPSDSAEQQDAEHVILAAVAADLGADLAPRRLTLGDGVVVDLDGVSADGAVLVEVYAHVGALRGAQPRKLAADAFKLAWVASRTGAERLILAVMDAEVETYLRRPRAWLTAALRDSGVEVVRVDVGEDVVERVASAQRRQFR